MIVTKQQTTHDFMEPDIIHASTFCDFEEAKQALENDPSCVHHRKNDAGMNALQVAISEFHEQMAIFLLDNTDISAMHQDFHGRCALKLAIQLGSDDLCERVEDTWNQQYRQTFENNKVQQFKP